MSPRGLWRLAFWYEQWTLGLVAQSATDIVRHGLRAPIRWLPPPHRWSLLADPFALSDGQGWRVVAESLDHRTNKGEIVSAPLDATAETWAAFTPLHAGPAHMSYPHPLHVDGRVLLFCETWEAHGITVLEHVAGQWRPVARLLEGRQILDATPWHDGTTWWLFCTLRDANPNGDLYLFHAAHPLGPWSPHPANPILRDPSCARPGGPLFRAGADLIRPGQDCRRTYGGGLTLNRITRLDREGYAEETIRHLEPIAPWPDGLHHLCPMGEQTLIDGKRWRFHAFDWWRKARLRRPLTARRRALANGISPTGRIP